MARFRELTVTRVTPLCEDAAAVTFAAPAAHADEFTFRPGQSLTLRRFVEGQEERRSYSVCSLPGEPLRIGVREVPGGVISGWLTRRAAPGDVIEALPPQGNFTPDLDQPGEHVMIAAGSGITPVLSITAAVLADPRSRATVLYGNRRLSTVMFADELADLKDAYPTRLQLVHILSREAQEVELFDGRLDAAKLTELLPAVCEVRTVGHWWLCGPYGMVTDAARVLADFDVPDERVHRELFYVEDTAPVPARHDDVPVTGGCEVTVRLDGRVSTMSVPRDAPILDGAHRLRPDVPFSCRGGVCGTCRAKVTGGQVTMRRNFALEPGEIADGYVLTCQARPVSDEVTIDFDA